MLIAEHSHAPIVGTADMLKTQSDINEHIRSTPETPQQIISGAAADLGEKVANMMPTLYKIITLNEYLCFLERDMSESD